MTSTRIPVLRKTDGVVYVASAGPATVRKWMAHGLLAGFRRVRTRCQEVTR